MGNFINKHFKKSKCVKVLLFDEGQKQTAHYVIPIGNTITIKKYGSFTLDRKSYFLDEKRVITYVFNRRNVEPINPFNMEDRAMFNPDEFTTAIDSHVADEILNHSKKMDIGIMNVITIMLMLIGFGLLYYTFTTEIKKVQPIVIPTEEVFNYDAITLR